MTKKLIQIKKAYFTELDSKAKYIAKKLSKKENVTKLLLGYTSDLYDSAKTEKDFENNKFKRAYHPPITSDLEFLIARVLFHYSNIKNLDWSVYLRKQKQNKEGKSVVPDIKLEKNGKIVSILEIKAKAGWMQPFFSKRKELKDIKSGKNPGEKIAKARAQLLKYANFDGCGKNNVYVLLPTFTLVSRKKDEDTVEDYRKAFAKNSRLNKDNLILLSDNKSLDLSKEKTIKTSYQPTDDFERFINKITERTSKKF